MSEQSDRLATANANLRAAIVAERQQVAEKFGVLTTEISALKAEVQALKDQIGNPTTPDEALIAEIGQTEAIAAEIGQIFEEPPTP